MYQFVNVTKMVFQNVQLYNYNVKLFRSSCLAEAVHDSLVIMLRLSFKRRLISLSPSSDSLVPSIFPVLTRRMLLPCRAQPLFCPPILEFVIGFVSNFYNWCALSLRTIQRKNEVSVLINGWVTANYSVSRPSFCPPSWNLLSDLCHTSTTHVRCHYAKSSDITKYVY